MSNIFPYHSVRQKDENITYIQEKLFDLVTPLVNYCIPHFSLYC